MKRMAPLILSFFACTLCYTQQKHISDFVSLDPGNQDANFNLPDTHTFQYLIENTDALSKGGTMPDNLDFTGYVPRQGSSKYGYLSVNSESAPGGVTILDLEFDDKTGKWIVDDAEAVDFHINPIPGSSETFATISNCSGTITPWGTVITCEETTSIETESYCNDPNNADSLKCKFFSERDNNNDGYDDFGWAIEIDPATKTIVNQKGGRDDKDKLWAMGNFKHENVVIHSNLRTVYQGADDTKGQGYLFKFVATDATDLSAGELYVYKGDKLNNHAWIKLKNIEKEDQNSTLQQCDDLGATNFGGIEDVEINPIDGMVYFAVKRESNTDFDGKGVVYRFKDTNPLNETGIENFEIYAGGGISYDGEPWGEGSDNLVFDDLGNLWVTQDGSFSRGDNNYIWVVENGHTQANPKVKIFARTPEGSEPTGLTFSPDFRYIFMSIQHPYASNSSTIQEDAAGQTVAFDKDITLVISRKEHLGKDLTLEDQDIMISQYYHDEASDSKWIEVKNIAEYSIPGGTYFLDLYDGASVPNISTAVPKATQAIPAMAAGEVRLFKNRENPDLPQSGYLGDAIQKQSGVCNFDGDDLILISTTPGKRKYINRKDILGLVSAGTWGANTSFIRGGNSLELPERDFDANNWIELNSLEEVSQADKLKNIALGTHVTGPAIWNGASWEKNSPPDRTRNTEINGSYLGGQEDFEAYDLTINTLGSFQFEDTTPGSNKHVMVHRDLTIDTNGSLIIGDTESLIINDVNAVISGKMTKIEKSADRGDTHDITYWSSPVQDEQIEKVFDEVNPKRIFYYDQSRYVSDETYWDVWVSQETGLMIPGKGYAAEGPINETGIHDISFHGSPNFGTIEVSDIVFNNDEGNNENSDNDFNLIGNPYPAAIDIEAFLKTNTEINEVIDGTAYFWTHDTPLTDNAYGDDYITYNFIGATGTDENTKVTANIGSGQGFFVRALKEAPVIFDQSMILFNANNQFFKSLKNKKNLGKNRLWINLKGSDRSFKQILIGFDQNATDGMDYGYDAIYLKGSQPIGFYSLLDSKQLSIQGLGPFDEEKVIQIGFDAALEGIEMTLEIDRMEGLLTDQDILLFDNENGKLHDLNTSPYIFNYNGKGTFSDRFSLLFNSAVLGIDEDIIPEAVKIYMKDQYLIIEAQHLVEQIKVYDALGRLVLKKQPRSAYNELNLDRIKTGGFFIVELVDSEGKALTRKMIKY